MSGPDPVVWISHRGDSRCAGCTTELVKGDFLTLTREHGARCAKCSGLGDLVFLPSGNTALTRRAFAASNPRAVVVKFSTARKRNERQGVLVQPAAIAAAEAACAADVTKRAAAREKAAGKAAKAEAAYRARFAAAIRRDFPGCPPGEADTIAAHACEKRSGRVGRIAAAKALAPDAIFLAVQAHVRHTHTRYDELFADGREQSEAREAIGGEVAQVLGRWRRATPESGPGR